MTGAGNYDHQTVLSLCSHTRGVAMTNPNDPVQPVKRDSLTPEQQFAMDEQAYATDSTSATEFDADGAAGEAPPLVLVEFDVACRKCAYNLRGLATMARCPECGAPVSISVRGELLRFSEPDWLKLIRRGAYMILIGVLIIGAVIGAIFLAGIFASTGGGFWTMPHEVA